MNSGQYNSIITSLIVINRLKQKMLTYIVYILLDYLKVNQCDASAYSYVKHLVSVFDYCTFSQSPIDNRILKDFTLK